MLYSMCCFQSSTFSKGKPADDYKLNHPDWVPNLHMEYKCIAQSSNSIDRYNRLQKWQQKKRQQQQQLDCQPSGMKKRKQTTSYESGVFAKL